MTEELPHIRCYECGNVLGNKWTRYQNYLSEGLSIQEALNKLGLSRYCCRGHMMNPIKVPVKSDRQVYPTETPSARVERLSIAAGPTPVLAPLEVLKIDSSKKVVAPSVGVIDLPPIPEVALPPVPGINMEPSRNVVKSVVKSYNAW